MIYHKVCEICGKEFTTTRYQQLICTVPHPKVCKQCGETFYVHGAQRNNEYCSKECKTLDTEERTCTVCGEKFHPSSKNQKMCGKVHKRICPVCGKEFVVKIQYPNQVCCSQKCRGVHDKESGAFERSTQKAKQTCMERYGTDSYSKTEEFSERFHATVLDHFGTEWPMQSEDIIDKRKSTLVDRYGTTNLHSVDSIGSKMDESRHNTYIERYGVDHPWELPEIREKIRETNLKRYGYDHPSKSEEIQEKVRQTSLARYGSTNIRKSDEGKKRIRDSMMKKYGVDNAFKSEEVKKKSRETMMKKYGVPSAAMSPDVQEKMKESTRNTCRARYGLDWPCLLPQATSRGKTISNINKSFSQALTDIGVENELEKSIEGRKSYDIYIPGRNCLIDIDPSYTHNCLFNPYDRNKPGKDINYHLDRTIYAENLGYRCIHVFDWDDTDKICSMFIEKEKIYARKCIVSNIDNRIASELFSVYHLQGTCRGISISYGIYCEDKLIGAMSFGKPRYTNKFEYELLRMCYLPDYVVVGGSEKMFSRFIRDNNPHSVLSYCDRSKYIGNVYRRLGMREDTGSKPSKHWWCGKKSLPINHVTDNLLRQRGFDQLMGTSFGKGTSNEELMINYGYLPVYDCGQTRFVWYAD